MLPRLSAIVKALGAMRYNPKSNETVALQLERTAGGRRAEHPFLLYGDRRYSYREANAIVNRYAHTYRAQGLRKGDTVALLMENRPEFLWHYLAACKLGIISSLINTHNTGQPLAHSLRVCEPKLITIGSELWAAFEQVSSGLGLDVPVWLDLDEGADSQAAPRWQDAIQDQSQANPAETGSHRLDDLNCYIYTSGTTGMPKAALVKHNKPHRYGRTFAALGWGLRPDDVIYNVLPLYHSNGLLVCTASCISAGVTMALGRKFSASRFWDEVRRYGATGFIYIGELCRYLMNQPPTPRDRDHKVRAIVGNGLRPDIWEPFQTRFGIDRIAEFYGSTEGNIGTLNLDNTVGSVGRLLFGGVLVKWDEEAQDFVRGPDGWLVKCQPGEPGVLLGRIRGRAAFDGYQDRQATEKKVVRDAFKKGDAWFNTGDLLRMDEKRNLYFVDRLGDTFRWKGENVSTFEVQEQLSSWPPAAEVNVYGVQIQGTEGRAGMASLVLDSQQRFNPQEFKRHVDSTLPGYARPMFVRVQDVLATTGTLKLKKADLRDDGFNPNKVRDPIYFRHPERDEYVEMTSQLYEDVVKGRIPL